MHAKELLKKLDFLQGLSEDEITSVAKVLEKKTYPVGKTVVLKGEVVSKLYILYKGSLSVTVKVQGQKKVVAQLKPGDYFGEMSLIEPMSATATISALEESVIYDITNEDFDKIVAKNPTALEILKNKIESRKKSLSEIH